MAAHGHGCFVFLLVSLYVCLFFFFPFFFVSGPFQSLVRRQCALASGKWMCESQAVSPSRDGRRLDFAYFQDTAGALSCTQPRRRSGCQGEISLGETGGSRKAAGGGSPVEARRDTQRAPVMDSRPGGCSCMYCICLQTCLRMQGTCVKGDAGDAGATAALRCDGSYMCRTAVWATDWGATDGRPAAAHSAESTAAHSTANSR